MFVPTWDSHYTCMHAGVYPFLELRLKGLCTTMDTCLGGQWMVLHYVTTCIHMHVIFVTGPAKIGHIHT